MNVIGDIAFWVLVAICLTLVGAVLFYSDPGE